MLSIFRKSLLTLVGIVGLSAFSQNAQAGFVYGAANTIGFENRENVNDADANNTLSVGDSIQGVLKVESITAGGPQSVTPEITGVFDVTVTHVLAIAGNLNGIAGGTEIDPISTGYEGKAIVLFAATNQTGVEGELAGMTKGTAVAFWQGGPNDVLATLNDSTKTTADVFNAAKDGALQGAFGFGLNSYNIGDYGKAGNGYWYAVVTYGEIDSGPLAGQTLPGISDPTATFFYGLQALDGPLATSGSGPVPLQNSSLDSQQTSLIDGNLKDSGTLIRDNRNTGSTGFALVGKGFQEPNDSDGLSNGTSAEDRAKFSVYSQDPAALFPTTPEPGSIALALIGGGLFVPMARRRRERKDASTVV